jgi:hypothetical protein
MMQGGLNTARVSPNVEKHYNMSRYFAFALTNVQAAVEGALEWSEAEVDQRTPTLAEKQVVAAMRTKCMKYIADLKVMLPSLFICIKQCDLGPPRSPATNYSQPLTPTR